MSNFTISEDNQSVTYSVNLLPADAANFTPYADITQEQAVQWTQDALGADRVTAMEAEVDALITQAAIPEPQPQPLPWVAPEPVVEEVAE
jgi:hypothetical protein